MDDVSSLDTRMLYILYHVYILLDNTGDELQSDLFVAQCHQWGISIHLS